MFKLQEMNLSIIMSTKYILLPVLSTKITPLVLKIHMNYDNYGVWLYDGHNGDDNTRSLYPAISRGWRQLSDKVDV